MRSRWHYICIILSCAFCCGCTSPSMRQLEQLEAQLDSMPDAVDLALDSIPFASLNDEEQALYAILRTQADYKCYHPLTTDTLIRYATDYYDGNKKDYRAAMAWYSLGCVYTELKDDASAIRAYLRATTLFPDTTVRYHALCLQNLGQHYLNREMFDDALCSLRACRRQSTMLNDSSTVGYCDYYTGCCYLYQKLYDSAEVYFDKVEANAFASPTCRKRLPLQRAKIAFYRDKEYDKALSFLDNHKIATTDKKRLGCNYSIQAEIYVMQQMYDSAYYYSQRIQSCSQELHTLCWNYKRLAELSALMGMHYSTASYIERHTLLLDSIYRLRQQKEINDIRNDFSIALYRQQQARQRAFHNILGLLVFIIVLLSIWLGFNRRENLLLKKNLRLDAELAQIRASLLYGIGKETKDTVLPALTLEEIQAYYSRLYDACMEQYKNTPSYTLMQSSPTAIEKLQREGVIVDIQRCFADFVSAIHNGKPNLSADIVLTCVCLSLGYSSNTIVNLLCISPETVRSRKYRAKQELSEPIFNLLCGTLPPSRGKRSVKD